MVDACCVVSGAHSNTRSRITSSPLAMVVAFRSKIAWEWIISGGSTLGRAITHCTARSTSGISSVGRPKTKHSSSRLMTRMKRKTLCVSQSSAIALSHLIMLIPSRLPPHIFQAGWRATRRATTRNHRGSCFGVFIQQVSGAQRFATMVDHASPQMKSSSSNLMEYKLRFTISPRSALLASRITPSKSFSALTYFSLNSRASSLTLSHTIVDAANLGDSVDAPMLFCSTC